MTDAYLTKQFKIGEAAKELGLSISGLRKWVRAGIIAPIRHPTGRLRFTGAEIRRMQNGRENVSQCSTT